MKRITYSVSIFLLIVFTITNCQFSFAQETSPSLWEGHIDYVIITSQEFADSQLEPNFYDLIAQKERDGLVARLVTTEYIYANYPGKDNPEKIRNFIKDAYQNFGARYVLLGGDADKEDVGGESGNNIVPVRYLYAYKSKLSDLNFSSLISSLSPSNFISLFYSIMMELTMSIFTSGIPSDLYYACLDGTFDANGNGKDGEPEDEPDLFADIYVGRAPVDSEQEVSNFVRKTLSYIEAKDNGDNYLYTTYQVGEDLSKDVSSMETMFDIDEEGMVYILQAISEMGMPQI